MIWIKNINWRQRIF